MTNEILFVIVIYKVKLAQSKTYTSLTSAINVAGGKADIYVYDNSPADFNAISVDTFSDLKNINLIYNRDVENSGISKAYNKAYITAIQLKKQWLLFFDQDTNLPPNSISKYILGIKENPFSTLLAPIIKSAEKEKIVSPCIYRFGRGFYLNNITPGISYLENRSLINCGLCVKMSAFEKAEGYNPAIKLDFSDFYFIEQYKTRVSGSFVILDLELAHSLSTTETQTKEQDANRFLFYLKGGKEFGKSMNITVWIFVNAFIRASKLSVMHKDLYFLRCFFLFYFGKNGE